MVELRAPHSLSIIGITGAFLLIMSMFIILLNSAVGWAVGGAFALTGGILILYANLKFDAIEGR